MTTQQLIPQITALAPTLVIFDKDGTLLDFHAMWGEWLTELARRLEAATNLTLASQLYRAMDFNPVSGQIAAEGQLALTPLAGLRALTAQYLRHQTGLSATATEAALATAWHLPDPVRMAWPLTDLSQLFTTLRGCGLKIAIATSDDRALTQATLAHLHLTFLVDALICADDGLPIKPAPDMVLSLCRRLTTSPAQTVVVGDNLPDLEMGRVAGAGLVIGVLSGLGSATKLAPLADLVLPSVANLVTDN